MSDGAVVLVTGYPATGKSHLARGLAERLALPLVTKDDIKERLADELGTGDGLWSHRLGQAAFGVLFDHVGVILRAGGSVVAEGNFDPDIAGTILRTMVTAHDARVVRVVLHLDPDEIVRRYEQRTASGRRHPVHLDAEALPRLRRTVATPYVPPDVDGPLIELDAADPSACDPEVVTRLVRERL
ncbi:MAG TPA: ATP-binding protein [Acidimicrobiales bacterium]|nr:ATP-binding protein [Acidimicrobiales bacterium]